MKYLRSWVAGILVAPIMLPLAIVTGTLSIIHVCLEYVIRGLNGLGISLCWVYYRLAGTTIKSYSEFMQIVGGWDG